jgi:hypothetical protein
MDIEVYRKIVLFEEFRRENLSNEKLLHFAAGA